MREEGHGATELYWSFERKGPIKKGNKKSGSDFETVEPKDTRGKGSLECVFYHED